MDNTSAEKWDPCWVALTAGMLVGSKDASMVDMMGYQMAAKKVGRMVAKLDDRWVEQMDNRKVGWMEMPSVTHLETG